MLRTRWLIPAALLVAFFAGAVLLVARFTEPGPAPRPPEPARQVEAPPPLQPLDAPPPAAAPAQPPVAAQAGEVPPAGLAPEPSLATSGPATDDDDDRADPIREAHKRRRAERLEELRQRNLRAGGRTFEPVPGQAVTPPPPEGAEPPP